ncbi:GNAT family N-acetyltransferase [Sulfuriflexus sp.]|uniref:GNAT family N-acetyltransferase n=1 Tax=Sulfuriflexus sp. TaxID=2015443 RepID=UPI0028CE250C|nr:GNAT family N-acetyltransferase [Sulfuriflexus sp.]MDT8405333.1 GNAT family N-acetyltransferase [Sulfuriflexus sp.]
MSTSKTSNTNKPYTVKRVNWQDAEAELRILREFVFIGEQNVPPELEWDGKDESCVHILAQDDKGRGIGTARMTTEGQIGRMAVLRAWRNRGVGSEMLTALITIAKARQLERVQLDAQTHAIDFYLRHDFTAQGEIFMDAGIPHQHMTRSLPPMDVHINIRDLPNQVLGETRGYIDLKGLEDNKQVAIHMAKQGQRSLYLFTPNLDPRVFDNDEFIDAVKNVALHNPRSHVKILILNPSQVVSRGHRIVELARRISSHVSIHRADSEDYHHVDTFMVVDEVGIIRRAHNDRFEGLAEFNNPGEARLLLKTFHAAWERSQPEPELRRLHL